MISYSLFRDKNAAFGVMCPSSALEGAM